jgi:hypothetical protein
LNPYNPFLLNAETFVLIMSILLIVGCLVIAALMWLDWEHQHLSIEEIEKAKEQALAEKMKQIRIEPINIDINGNWIEPQTKEGVLEEIQTIRAFSKWRDEQERLDAEFAFRPRHKDTANEIINTGHNEHTSDFDHLYGTDKGSEDIRPETAGI